MHFPESDRRAEDETKNHRRRDASGAQREGSASPGIQTSGKSWECNEGVSAETHNAQNKRKHHRVLTLHGRVCVCVCVCKGVCGGSEVVIDENNDRLAGTGQFETGAIITLWTSHAAFKLLFKKTPWERRQRGVYQCVYSLWGSASRRCERSLCVYVCVR